MIPSPWHHFLRSLSSLIGGRPSRGRPFRKKAARRARLGVELLEDRLVPSAVRDLAGFTANTLPPTDDGSTAAVALGFDAGFFGTTYSSLYVNNNGNVTFDDPLGEWVPFELTGASIPIIAPFFADVDTLGSGSLAVTYGQDTVEGRAAFGVNWVGVGYFPGSDDLLNSFQLVLIDRSDVAAGAFDIEFNYDQVQWDTTTFEGTYARARAGYAGGVELAGSGESGAFLDDNTTTGLIHSSYNSMVAGRYFFEVRGTGGNQAPVPRNPGNQSDVVGYPIGLAISASDPDGDSLTYSAPELPPGLNIDSASGYISGTITSEAVSGSPYTVTVTVFDGVASASQTFEWYVNFVGLANPGAQNNLDSDPVLLPLQGQGTSGPLIFDAAGLPDGLSIDPDTGVISGTIAATADAGSPYTVTVTASDGTYSASQTFPWYVGKPAPPGLGSPGDQVNAAGDEVALSLSAIGFSTAGLTYSALGLPEGLEIDPDTGLIWGTITDAAASDTPYEVTATVTDGTTSVSQTFFWTVNFVGLENPGTQLGGPGDSVSLALEAHTASGSLTFTASGLPDGLSIELATGLISGTIAATADEGSPYTVTVTASDGTHEASQSFTWYVGELPFLWLYPPGDQVNAAGDSVALQLLATDGDIPVVTYSASGLPDGLNFDPDTGLISGTLSDDAASATPYEVAVAVTDGTKTASQTFFWTVNFVGLEDPGTQYDDAGDAVSLELQAHAASGTLTFTASGLPDGLSIELATGLISGTIAATADTGSPYTVTVTGSNGTHEASQTFTWYVGPQPTLALDPPGNQFNAVGDEIELQLWATVPSGVTLTYAASNLPDGLNMDEDTGLIFGTITAAATSDTSYEVTAAVSDGTNSVSQTFHWMVTFIGLENPDTQYNRDWDMVSLPVAAHGTTGRQLTFSASGLPGGLSIDWATGLISGTIAATADEGSPYTVTVTASDGMHSARQTFQWFVEFQPALALAAPGHQVSAVGEEVELQLAAIGTTSDPISYSASGLPDGLDIDPDTGVISGTVSMEAGGDTPYLVTVTAFDGTNTVSQTFAWRVTPEGAPQMDVPGDTLATARPVEFDQSEEVVEVADAIGNNSYGNFDVDLYRVELAEGDWLAVAVRAYGDATTTDPDFRIAVRIFDSSGNELLVAGDVFGLLVAGDVFGLYPWDEIAFEAPADGTYYVGISYHGNTGYNPFLAGSGVAGLTGTYALSLSYFAAAAAQRPRGPATLENFQGRFWETVPGLRTYGGRIPQGVETAHTIPRDWANVFQQKKRINIHEPQWIRGMTKFPHQTYDSAFQAWMDARMKQMGLNPGSVADQHTFRNTVDLDEVLKVQKTLLDLDYIKLRMITSGMDGDDIGAVLKKSGLTGKAADSRKAVREAAEAQTTSKTALQGAFPKLKKFLSAVAVLSVIGEGLALAGNIAGQSPLAQAAFDDFAQKYGLILDWRQRGQRVSVARWWDLFDALNAYLEQAGVSETARAFTIKWAKENIGPPQDDLYWP